MANKARYYGLVTREQQDVKTRAKESPFINVEELTQWTIYSAIALYPEIDSLSSIAATRKIKELLIRNGFTGKLTVEGSSISDEYNHYVLTRSKSKGIVIVKETHEEKKRKR